jgi:hypothetical protein
MTPTDAQGAAPRCECGHERDKHSLRGGICLHRAPSGGWIECPCLAYRPPTAGPPPAPAAEPREDRPRCAECGWLTRWREDGVWACWTRACVKFDQPLSRPAAPSVPPDLRGLVDAATRVLTVLDALYGFRTTPIPKPNEIFDAITDLRTALAARPPAPSTETSDQ